ncbi:D-3-phosphoglycerate dehydrogenase [Papilio machaon]|uniref:D-3-phosphoglycerate dehydrogenase n=1 Tax=Papilio machaon TaxID=76193 RepID=A0A194QZJ4_PAPMA|nr:D-3-phosphoglycerate dehydrogenase [Papilio machaon]
MVVDIKLVLVLDGIGESCTNILNFHGIQTISRPDILRKDLLNDLYAYDAIVVRPDTLVTKEIVAAAFRLKVVALASPGYGQIDVEAASHRGVSVIKYILECTFSAPNSTVISACELICGLLLAVAKHMRPARTAFSKGLWNYGSFKGTELKDRTVAIIGCGRVGKGVASRMSAFGMKIIGFDPFATQEQCEQYYISKMTQEEQPAFQQWLDIHSPLLQPTRNFINADVIRRCKTGVKIINVGRGGLINERDLLDALNSGQITSDSTEWDKEKGMIRKRRGEKRKAKEGLTSCQVGGAAIDVYEGRQKDPVTLSLIEHPSVIATPHIATSTTDVPVHAAKEIAEQIVNLVKPGTYSTMLSELNKIYD